MMGEQRRIISIMPDDVLSRPAPPYDFRVAYGSDPNQFIDLRVPSHRGKPSPVVMNIHGGYWRAKYNLEHAGYLCAALTSQGWATANVEYRRVGNDGGAWPGTFADVRSAYQFLMQNAQKHSLDSKHFVVMGHSAGGQLALCLAAHERSVTRVISLAGVVDLRQAYELHLSNDAVVEFLRGTPSAVPDHYREADPMELSIPQAHQSLILGSADVDVPPKLSHDYVDAKQKRRGDQKEDVHLLEVSGADHFNLIDPQSQAWKQVQKTVQELTS